VAYLKRGKVYNIDGFKLLVLGGALSIDKDYQIKNNTWWEREYWSEQEEKDVFNLLETENSFDCVVSHTGPEHINNIILESRIIRHKTMEDKVAILNDEICKRIQFKEWLCGHLHRDQYLFDSEKNCGYQYLYRSTVILEKTENNITVHKEYCKNKM